MAKVDPRAPLPGKEVEKVPHQKSAQDSYLDPRGREMPSPLSIAPPIGYKRTPSLSDQIRQIVISEKLAQEARTQGYESFEEADDFDVPDEDVPVSAFEMEEDFEGDSDRGAVEDWIKARAIEMGFTAPASSAESGGQGQAQPAAPAAPQAPLTPAEAPNNPAPAPSAPHGNPLIGFLRRG